MGKFKDHSKRKTAETKAKKNPIKVTYISSPMKVKASSASEFRAIVQELTGKNSDVVKDLSDDSYATVDQPHEEANNYQVINLQEGDRHMQNDVNVFAADDYLFDDAFSSHVSSVVLDQIDEGFKWRDVSAESSFGFQSPYCLSLYD
ncbi:sigma factor binding protein 2, chloroplastic-like [Pistacia vera]|uniref:sigma factor binding protein 2, chloroplastic-like n=1 Tax=Pistacia vera TaxID=55513 RepID=UPI001263A3B5|nr:sigma factor binding protein 2, chloroplastic-like [Pistacia vera]